MSITIIVGVRGFDVMQDTDPVYVVFPDTKKGLRSGSLLRIRART